MEVNFSDVRQSIKTNEVLAYDRYKYVHLGHEEIGKVHESGGGKQRN